MELFIMNRVKVPTHNLAEHCTPVDQVENLTQELLQFDSKEDNKFKAVDEMPNQCCKRKCEL